MDKRNCLCAYLMLTTGSIAVITLFCKWVSSSRKWGQFCDKIIPFVYIYNWMLLSKCFHILRMGNLLLRFDLLSKLIKWVFPWRIRKREWREQKRHICCFLERTVYLMPSKHTIESAFHSHSLLCVFLINFVLSVACLNTNTHTSTRISCFTLAPTKIQFSTLCRVFIHFDIIYTIELSTFFVPCLYLQHHVI